MLSLSSEGVACSECRVCQTFSHSRLLSVLLSENVLVTIHVPVIAPCQTQARFISCYYAPISDSDSLPREKLAVPVAPP
jgi:hypothetical protein